MHNKLNRNFFEQPTLTVAKELLGKILVFNNIQGIITETEAYIGENDPACHAAKGRTNRTEIMYGIAGFSYVYMIYGMYYCLNIVTEKEGFPAAVLIRGVILNSNSSSSSSSSSKLYNINNINIKKEINGPGKLCRCFGISKEHNKINLITSDFFYVASLKKNINVSYTETPRIGIKLGLDKLWRFKMCL